MSRTPSNDAPKETHSSAAVRLAEIRAMKNRLADLEKEILAEADCAPARMAESELSTEEFVELKIAAAAFVVCTDTMLAYVKKHGIGQKVAGRWRVDMTRARAWRDGRPYNPL